MSKLGTILKQRYYLLGLLGVVAAGVIFRALFALRVPTEQMYDFATYRELALNIKNGLGHQLNGVPVAWQGPLYPYVLGLFYRLTGTDSELAGKVLNIILSSLTLLLSCPLYHRMFTDRRLAFAAVALTAFLPANIAYVNILGTEVLFVFILIGIICLQLFYSGRRLFYPLIGLLTGFAALTKPFMLAFPIILAVIFWLQRKKPAETLIFAGVVCLCMCVVVTPWAVRNYRLFGRVIPVSYNGGYVRYINNNDGNHNGLWMDLANVPTDDVSKAEIARLQEEAGGVKAAPELEPLLSTISNKWIIDNPTEFMKLGFLRFNQTFFNGADDLAQWAMNTVEYKAERDKSAVEVAFGLIAKVLSAAGLLFVLRFFITFLASLHPKRCAYAPDAIAFLCLVFFVAVVFMSEGQARYAFPVYPFLVYAVLRLWPVRNSLEIS